MKKTILLSIALIGVFVLSGCKDVKKENTETKNVPVSSTNKSTVKTTETQASSALESIPTSTLLHLKKRKLNKLLHLYLKVIALNKLNMRA